MDPSRRTSPIDENAKEWDPSFSSRRDFQDWNEPYIESQKRFGAVGDDLELFLRDYVGKVPSSKVEEVKVFFQVYLAAVETEEARAWVDDREWDDEQPSGRPRHYPNRVDCDRLYGILKEKRVGLEGFPNVDRRLVCVTDLDPNYILAIARMTPQHLVYVLRDAIWGHISLQPSFRVGINSSGFPLFRLQFQLPYYAMRRVRPLPAPTHPVRNLVDISFLDIQSPEEQEEIKYYLQDAEISLVICGPDNNHWTGYAFVDTCLEDITYHEDTEDEDDNDDEDDEEGDGEDEEETVEDPIFGNDLDQVLQAREPIRDARKYFIAVMDIRVRCIVEEWRFLIRYIEECEERYRTSSLLSRTSDLEEIKRALYWTLQTWEVLRKLQKRLSGTMRAWKSFSSSGGDIGYFADISREGFRTRRLDRIKESFDELEDLEHTLLHLVKSCERSSRNLELYMGVESNQLNLDGNRLSLENNRVNLETSSLSRDGLEVNRRTNQINQVISPVIIVLTYWSAQRDIFSFERNPKAFWISTIVVLVSVRVFDFLLSGSDSMKRILSWLLMARDALRRILTWLLIAGGALKKILPCALIAGFRRGRANPQSDGAVVIELTSESRQPV